MRMKFIILIFYLIICMTRSFHIYDSGMKASDRESIGDSSHEIISSVF